MNWTNLLKPLLITAVINFTTSILMYKFFGIEVALLYSISISAGFICMAIVGIENILINYKK